MKGEQAPAGADEPPRRATTRESLRLAGGRSILYKDRGAMPYRQGQRRQAPGSAMLDTFQPLLDAARGIDLDDPAEAETKLRLRLDPGSPAAAQLNAALVRLLAEGAIANRGEPPVRYGRVTKAGPATGGFSIDAVHMSAAGPRHRHPNGEIDWCVPLSGAPTFDGRAAGWVVLPPGSVHVPTVAGGEMLVVYLLPEGAIEFLERPA